MRLSKFSPKRENSERGKLARAVLHLWNQSDAVSRGFSLFSERFSPKREKSWFATIALLSEEGSTTEGRARGG
jgi:hypothetical protein